MSQASQISIVPVKESDRVKRNAYDPTDIDSVLCVVKTANDTRNRIKKTQAEQDRILALQRREARVAKREQEVQRKEDEYRIVSKFVNTILNAILVGFSILGMMTAVWFWASIH